jgi:hypothetical protein
MGRTACTETQCLYKGAIYFMILKTPLHQERRKGLGTEQNPEEILKIVFSEEVLRLRIAHTDD